METQRFCTFSREFPSLGRFDESASAFDIQEEVINLNVLIHLIVQQSNLSSQQNERNFLTNAKKIGVNYIVAVNQLINIPVQCDCNHFVGNADIQNIFAGIRYQEVLQNLHFADSPKQGKTDKPYKIKTITDHLNESFQAVFSNQSEQSIDYQMIKFTRRSSMRQ